MITKKDVEHIAALARIKLTAEEKEKMEKELSAILGFVEKLNEVETADIEPMAGGTGLQNIWREDKQIDKSLEQKSAELINAAPKRKDDWIKVKAIFE